MHYTGYCICSRDNNSHAKVPVLMDMIITYTHLMGIPNILDRFMVTEMKHGEDDENIRLVFGRLASRNQSELP